MESDFKGFGEGFERFPRHLPEDSIEYSLFVVDSTLKLQKEVRSRLEAVRRESMKLCAHLLKNYIWQRDSYKLDIKAEKGSIFLYGVTNYGDCLEDEWLIVYILRELSNSFSDLWIKVVDTDGEFLLIEAANVLPRWLKPDIADNRVWINNNSLRIIPRNAVPPLQAKDKQPKSRPLELEEALNILRSAPDTLVHSPLIEAEAFYRLKKYPAQITASLHHAGVTIPRKLAYVLHSLPAAIAPATEAFYLRDPISLRLLQSSSSKLVFPPGDLVTCTTRFTKVLYAQLKSQEFKPPDLWQGMLNKCALDISSGKIGKDMYARLETGMKVTCGFEMLLSDSQHKDSPIVREIKILLEDLAADETLQSTEEISKWAEGREDDEKWLDINFEAFERELQAKNQGQKPEIGPVFGPEPPPNLWKELKVEGCGLSLKPDHPGFFDPHSRESSTDFGDPHVKDWLRRYVSQNEAAVNGGRQMEGDDLHHEGFDFSSKYDAWKSEDSGDSEDDEEEEEEDSEEEDKTVSFDEKEFSRMMKEMMGMPADEDEEEAKQSKKSKKSAASQPREGGRIEEMDSTDDEDGDGDKIHKIQDVMEKMEAELKEAGALNLNSTPAKSSSIRGKGKAVEAKEDDEMYVSEDDDNDGDDDVNIDFHAARQLLESLQAQAGTGMGGPAANLLNMMRIQSLKDEAESESSREKS